MSTRIGIRDVRVMLQERIEPLCRELLPDGRRESNHWVARNPTRADREAGSFKVWLKGQGRGAWIDYATGEKGDVIDLIVFVHGTDRSQALAWAKGWLGITRMDDSQRQAVRQRAQNEQAAAEKRSADRERWKRKKAFEIFAGAQRIPRGSPAEAYFIARACPLADVPNLSTGSLRFMPSMEWWKGAQFEDRNGRRVKARAGPHFPTVVSALRNGDGVLTGIHCTFLQPDGSGKAPVDPPKLMFGTAKGSVIRIADGPSGKPPDEARGEASTLVLTEGLENGLTAAIALPEARVWAAGSLSNLAEAPVGIACVDSVIVAGDRDDNAKASEALQRALDSLEAHGKPVALMQSFIGSDINDLARELNDVET